MTDAWLLRWDTAREPRPSLVRAADVSRFGPGSTGFVAFQGYLFDRGELSVGQSASDAGLVASAYERWQNALFDKLRGGFALAIWDEERRYLVVGRDAMGLIPCFYWWNERVLLASPSLDAILGQPEVDTRFNRVLVAEYLQNIRGFQQLHETFYEDIRRLPPAHTLSVSGAALSLTRYWDPVPAGFAWATEGEVSRFTEVLGTAVDRSLSAGADSLALSGGFDSVSIAVVAAERRHERMPLHAVSLRFTDPSCDEGPRQTQVAQALGMPQVMRSLDECLDEDSFVGELRALSSMSPCPVMSAWQPMYVRLLRSAADRGLGHLMTGTGGDEMYYVNMGYAVDCLRALDARGLWRFCRACHSTWPGAPARVARYVLWDGAIKRELRRQARTLLGRVSPRARDWVLARRLRRARNGCGGRAHPGSCRPTTICSRGSSGGRSMCLRCKWLPVRAPTCAPCGACRSRRPSRWSSSNRRRGPARRDSGSCSPTSTGTWSSCLSACPPHIWSREAGPRRPCADWWRSGFPPWRCPPERCSSVNCSIGCSVSTAAARGRRSVGHSSSASWG